MINKQSTSPTVFETIDNDMRRAIIQLNQKLLDLQKEITAKLTTFEISADAQHDTQKKQLSLLVKEVERALNSIDEVVNMAVSKDLTHSEFLKLHHDQIY